MSRILTSIPRELAALHPNGNPVERLDIAVLHQTLEDLDKGEQGEFMDAALYFFRDDSRLAYPYSFSQVCRRLGLDANGVALKLWASLDPGSRTQFHQYVQS